MILLLISACDDCPSFADMTVVDTTGNADVSVVEQAIETFANATGRAGVCVPGIELDDGPGPFSHDWEGVYAGPGSPIRVKAKLPNLERVTFHELCHALDAEEGISSALPDAFPAEMSEDDTVFWSDAARRAEVFAEVCDDGPSDEDLAIQVDEACGTEPYGEGWSTVQRTVYRAVEHTELPSSDADVHVEQVSIPAPTDVARFDMGGAGEELVVLGWWPTEAGEATGVVRIDPDTGGELGRVTLAEERASYAVLAQSDGPAVVLLPAGDDLWSVDQVDLPAGSVTRLGEVLVPYTHSWTWVASAGRHYVVTRDYESDDDGVHAWLRAEEWLDGVFVDLDPPAVEVSSSIRAGPDGFEVVASDASLIRFDHALGWTEQVVPFASNFALYPWTEKARLMIGSTGLGGWTPLVVDVDTGDVSLPADPCQSLSWGWDAVLDDRILVMGGSAPEGSWAFRQVRRPG